MTIGYTSALCPACTVEASWNYLDLIPGTAALLGTGANIEPEMNMIPTVAFVAQLYPLPCVLS
jgi:hypothetical protein